MTAGNRGRSLIWRVTLPFLAGYFLSYAYRAVNALLGPLLAREFGISAAELGFLTSVYFLAFGVFQIPLGVLLDRFGPRRVNAFLLLIAACGAVIFCTAQSYAALVAGRALIGFGVSGCLMSSFQAWVLWHPPERIAFMNAIAFATGVLGAIATSVPLDLLLRVLDWRQAFLLLIGFNVVVVCVLVFVVPEGSQTSRGESLRQSLSGVGRVLSDPAFWRIGIALLGLQSATVALLTLWMATWLRDVAGYSRAEVAQVLLLVNVALIAGFLGYGRAADARAASGRSVFPLFAGGIAGAAFCLLLLTLGVTTAAPLLWMLFIGSGSVGSLAYSILTRRYPREMTGRVNATLNIFTFSGGFLGQWGVGLVIDRWPQSAAGYDPQAYSYAFGILLCVMLAGLTWLWRGRRLLAAA
ncbi:MAG: hypothetical protein A3I63_05145 [Betaproteobacteria bacterium RIFCSPLOWO2_02_FULL_66_14]|nr:MAG: hypothetical protein A3I63_05145 [Betaproteobacteria bacterium RIFCSPLOWO2_02_FULL_66_14]